MKLDMGVLLHVLRAVEEIDNTYTAISEVPGLHQSSVEYHLDLAVRTGFIKTRGVKDFWGNERVFGHMLTWAGHEYLDQRRHQLPKLIFATRQPGGERRLEQAKEKFRIAKRNQRIKNLFLTCVYLRRPVP